MVLVELFNFESNLIPRLRLWPINNNIEENSCWCYLKSKYWKIPITIAHCLILNMEISAEVSEFHMSSVLCENSKSNSKKKVKTQKVLLILYLWKNWYNIAKIWNSCEKVILFGSFLILFEISQATSLHTILRCYPSSVQSPSKESLAFVMIVHHGMKCYVFLESTETLFIIYYITW